VSAQLLIHSVNELERPMRKSCAPFYRLDPYSEEGGCEVSLISGLEVEHATLQGIAEVPSLIDKPLWSVRVSIDDEGVRMDFCWVMDDHERRLLLGIENSDCINAIVL
jgi:hypothetical protein